MYNFWDSKVQLKQKSGKFILVNTKKKWQLEEQQFTSKIVNLKGGHNTQKPSIGRLSLIQVDLV